MTLSEAASSCSRSTRSSKCNNILNAGDESWRKTKKCFIHTLFHATKKSQPISFKYKWCHEHQWIGLILKLSAISTDEGVDWMSCSLAMRHEALFLDF
jgi:hypothetical protein